MRSGGSEAVREAHRRIAHGMLAGFDAAGKAAIEGRVGIAGDDEVIPVSSVVQGPAQARLGTALGANAPRPVAIARDGGVAVAMVVVVAVARPVTLAVVVAVVGVVILACGAKAI